MLSPGMVAGLLWDRSGETVSARTKPMSRRGSLRWASIDPSWGELLRSPPYEARARLLWARHEDDDLPVQITVGQLTRIGQIIVGAIVGKDMRASLTAVERFIIAVVSESGRRLAGTLAYHVRDAWVYVDRWRLSAPEDETRAGGRSRPPARWGSR